MPVFVTGEKGGGRGRMLSMEPDLGGGGRMGTVPGPCDRDLS